jgi:hypothetical protein
MSRKQATTKGNHQPQNSDALHGCLNRVARQTEVHPPVEQHKADQESDDRSEARAEIEGFHKP